MYNACDRRNLNKTDLERIADNLETTLGKLGISIIYDTDKLKGEAKYTEEYKIFNRLRNSKKSALHDAIAILHIKKARKKAFRDFDKVNAWFVNNSASVEGNNIFMKNGYQPETIKADDLLNILWLSNPIVNKAIEGDDLADIGLTSTLSLTLNSNLPKSQILRELDDNIHKYAKENISDTDIIRVATRITNKQLKNIEELNELAEQEDKTLFVKSLEEEAKKQKKIEEVRIKKLESLFKNISIRTEELEKSKREYIHKSKNIDKTIVEKEDAKSEVSKLKESLLLEQNQNRKIKRDKWIKNEVKKWRTKTWIEFILSLTILIFGILYMLCEANWNISNSINLFTKLKSNILFSGGISLLVFIFTSITIKTLFNKYRNHSNINNYKIGLEVPEEMKELNKAL
ncbi:hypothetical protein PG910_07130 [Tenacibaculum dicentrarchi]|nr:hypothetical protein PG910_07130 [Tenacibaculum dicentrarchi]